MGREIVVADRMDLHLLWANDRSLFLKPLPHFLLDPDLAGPPDVSRGLFVPRPFASLVQGWPAGVALGFLYTYACLLSSETDFFIANKKRLLPREADDSTIRWAKWKEWARELLEKHDPDKVHPRFLRAELRLSRINTIHRFSRRPPFDPYLRGWHNCGSRFRDNLAWIAAATVFIALVLTAMRVGLATERLHGDAAFRRASYGFTIFAILGPLCAFGLVALGAL